MLLVLVADPGPLGDAEMQRRRESTGERFAAGASAQLLQERLRVVRRGFEVSVRLDQEKVFVPVVISL